MHPDGIAFPVDTDVDISSFPIVQKCYDFLFYVHSRCKFEFVLDAVRFFHSFYVYLWLCVFAKLYDSIVCFNMHTKKFLFLDKNFSVFCDLDGL